MKAFNLQNDWEWTKRYYSADARKHVEERRQNTPRDVIERGERDWAELLAEVERAAAIQGGLNRLWSDSANWPTGFTRPWSDAADAFIKAALERNGAVDRD